MIKASGDENRQCNRVQREWRLNSPPLGHPCPLPRDPLPGFVGGRHKHGGTEREHRKDASHEITLESNRFRAYTEGGGNVVGDIEAVFAAMKRRLRNFTSVPRGQRFRAHCDRMQQRPHLVRTLLVIGLGLLLLALGLVMLVLPGPGLLVGFAGAALIAGESRRAAQLLDRIDLCAMRVWNRWRG